MTNLVDLKVKIIIIYEIYKVVMYYGVKYNIGTYYLKMYNYNDYLFEFIHIMMKKLK